MDLSSIEIAPISFSRHRDLQAVYQYNYEQLFEDMGTKPGQQILRKRKKKYPKDAMSAGFKELY
jgi:hypothetical protein